MLFIFRKLRRSFFPLRQGSEGHVLPGKVRTYCAYAVGEIALIMIGILLALQVSDWNQARKDSGNAKQMLLNLQSEFNTNLSEVDRVLIQQKRSFDATVQLYAAIEKSIEIDKEILDGLVGWTMMDFSFNAKMGGLQDILNSDKLILVKNQELRTLMTSFSGVIDDLREEQDRQRDFGTNVYFPYLAKHVAVRDVTQHLSLQGMGRMTDLFMTPSKVHNTNYDALLSQQEFESLLETRNLISQAANIELQDIKTGIKRILALIELELEGLE